LNKNGVKTIYKSALTYSETSSSSSSSTAYGESEDDDADVIEDYAAGWTWTTLNTTKSASYASATVSSDGAVIVAVIGEGTIQVSKDAGESWESSKAAGKHVDWSDVITSADGSVIVAVSHEGLIYTSTDTGSTFSQADVAEDDFVSVKCSSDGSIVLVGSVNTVYLSTDYGLSFASINMSVPHVSENATASSVADDDAALYSVNLEVTDDTGTDDYYYGNGTYIEYSTYALSDFILSNTTSGYHVAMDSNGSYLFAASSSGDILSSDDSGETWSQVYFYDGNPWTSIASNNDSSVLLASTTSSYLYVSYDYGSSWSALNNSDTNAQTWNYVDVSSDGDTMIACSKLSPLWVSNNGGLTWNTSGTRDTWTSASLTGDGKTVIVSSAGLTAMQKLQYF